MTLPHIAILSASVRTGRNSHRAALFLRNLIVEKNLATAEIIDLNEYQFPLFHERLMYQDDPLPALLDYSRKIKEADGVVIVTPEYNGGYPASLKNAIDVLYPEWQKKPVAISTCSDGDFGGNQLITSIQFVLWKMHVLTVPAMFPNPHVDKAYDEQGVPSDKEGTEKRAMYFLKELLWCIEAGQLMKKK
ncbi:MAG: NAD(P)H-dependent oxidoreductase [Bacteroidetes bacterium]|nr:NAD(P)H-dependent oxidoreductase [Bacteroidota bacterium]